MSSTGRGFNISFHQFFCSSVPPVPWGQAEAGDGREPPTEDGELGTEAETRFPSERGQPWHFEAGQRMIGISDLPIDTWLSERSLSSLFHHTAKLYNDCIVKSFTNYLLFMMIIIIIIILQNIVVF